MSVKSVVQCITTSEFADLQNATHKLFVFQILHIMYMYKPSSALNDQMWLFCHKTQKSIDGP